jgi:hypothetical protein
MSCPLLRTSWEQKDNPLSLLQPLSAVPIIVGPVFVGPISVAWTTQPRKQAAILIIIGMQDPPSGGNADVGVISCYPSNRSCSAETAYAHIHDCQCPRMDALFDPESLSFDAGCHPVSQS